MKTKINNYIFEIELVDNPKINENIVFGLTDFISQKIQINSNASIDCQKITLMHELTHAYLYSYGFGSLENLNVEIVCDFVALYSAKILRKSIKIMENLYKNEDKSE